tara:strand:+ start:99 stop:881 length:783 start_codon:yes stop_codon:yes gene_type:complete
MVPACKEIRENIIKASHVSGQGHIPTCFSVVEILYSLYGVIKHNPLCPDWKHRDIFILSKGHASLAHYCVLEEFGYLDDKKVETFGAFMSDFGCHSDKHKVPGVEASTGSLGHGIGIAVGIALAFKIKKSRQKVFTLIGDGESNEGTVWEAVMIAVSLNLDNLTIIYDNNMSHARGLQIHNPAAHFHGFGCETVDIDGHDIDALKKEIVKESSSVRVLIADTKKGYGCNTLLENQYEWHRKSPNDEELELLMMELDEKTV